MELDELKIQLQRDFEEYKPQKSGEAIALLLHQNTRAVIANIKRSLKFELWMTISFIAALLYLTINTSTHSFKLLFAAFALLSAVFSGILFFLLKQANELTTGLLPVKETTQKLYDIIRRYIQKYAQFTMGLLPVFFIISFAVGYRQTLAGEDWEFDSLMHSFSDSKHLLLSLAVIVIASAIVTFFFTRWYLKKLYGNYLNELKELLEELEE